MPFITIELSQSLQFSLAPFAEKVHGYLAEALAIPVEKLKTKVVYIPDTYVGVGDPEQTYARLKFELIKGRDRQKLKNAIQQLVEWFKEALLQQNPRAKCRITCEIQELDPDFLCALQLP